MAVLGVKNAGFWRFTNPSLLAMPSSELAVASMNSNSTRLRLRFSLRSLLLVCCTIAILIAYRQSLVDCYHRMQIYALTHGYCNGTWQRIVARVEYHYSALADSGSVARVSRKFVGATAPDLSRIMRLPNLPPHQFVSVERGTKTTVNVYADRADEQKWAVILESLGP